MRLPWVVAPCPGEWLGFWLHRVAQPYGLEVAAILHQAGISFDKGPMPTWGRLGNLGKADLHLLALALGERPSRLHDMQRRISENGLRSQVGYCRACLLESRRPGCPRHWRRDWLDPYIGWCGKHRHGLMTLDAREGCDAPFEAG